MKKGFPHTLSKNFYKKGAQKACEHCASSLAAKRLSLAHVSAHISPPMIGKAIIPCRGASRSARNSRNGRFVNRPYSLTHAHRESGRGFHREAISSAKRISSTKWISCTAGAPSPLRQQYAQKLPSCENFVLAQVVRFDECVKEA